MPTSQLESRAHNALPDIFQTLNGSHFDIGMFDHLRDSGSKVYTAPWGRGVGQPKELPEKQNFPRIILRDALGHELDTFTTLQEAIYRAKWNVKQSGQAKEPIEWRLPKAPPPARPDLTRTFPPLKHPPVVHPDGRVKTKWDHSRVLEFDVEDVGFVRESLQYLPFAPSLSFLRQEILVGPKTYFQIVGTMLLHNRVLSQTEKRQAIHKFPGFCSGCIRMGICYGCERSSEVHFHEDKPVKTGGGFTYFRKDRPEREMQRKNPINWKVRHPDKALKKLMEEYGGVELEGEIPAEIKRHLDEHGGHREKIVSIDCNDGDKLGNKRKRKANIHVSYNMDGNNEVTGGDLGENQGHGEHDLDITDVRVDMDYDGGDSGSDSEQDDPNIADDLSNQTEGYKKGGATRRTRKSRSTGRSKSEAGMASARQKHGLYTAKSSSRDRSYDQHTDTDRMYENSTSDEENMERGNRTDSSSPNRSNRRKEKLYKAPPAFKIKKTTKRSIEARSPFSTNRSYDLPKGKGIDIKKSDKGPTQFKDFNKADPSWKEPKKFELKKVEQKTTKFWSGSPKKKEEKRPTPRRTDTNGDRSRGVRRVPSPRSISPDSGLESELLTAHRKIQADQHMRTVDREISHSSVSLNDDGRGPGCISGTLFTQESDKLTDRKAEKPTSQSINQESEVNEPSKNESKLLTKTMAAEPIIQSKYLELDGSDESSESGSEELTNRMARKYMSQSRPLESDDSESSESGSEHLTNRMARKYMSQSRHLESDDSESSESGSEHLTNRMARKLNLAKFLESKVNESYESGSKELSNRKAGIPTSQSNCFDTEVSELSDNGSKIISKRKAGKATSQSDGSEIKISRSSSSGSKRIRNKKAGKCISQSNCFKTEVSRSAEIGSQSDSMNTTSSNQSTLDDFNDTAAEYYKDFDIEQFQRKKSLHDYLQKSAEKLPPLPVKKGQQKHQFHSKTIPTKRNKKYIMYQPRNTCISPILYMPDNHELHQDEEDSGEAVELMKLYKDHLSSNIPDIDKVTRNKKADKIHQTADNVSDNLNQQHGPAEDKDENFHNWEAEDTFVDSTKEKQKGHAESNNERFHKDRANDTYINSNQDHGQEMELNIQPTFDQMQKNMGREGRIVDRERTPPSFMTEVDSQWRFMQEGYIGSNFRNRSNSVQNASRWFKRSPIHTVSPVLFEKKKQYSLVDRVTHSQASKRSGSVPLTSETTGDLPVENSQGNRSFIRQYQQLHNRLHCRRSDSLPSESVEEFGQDHKLAMQRSRSLGKNENCWPTVNQVINYNKHVHKNVNFAENMQQRCNTPASENNGIITDPNERLRIRRRMSLKVPTGGRDSLLSTGQSQLTGSLVDKSFIEEEQLLVSARNRKSKTHVVDITHAGSCQKPLSPSLIPLDIDMDKGSLTSCEPDLELIFDDVIDVENLEAAEVDENMKNEDDMHTKEERKRRHKHRKHRRRKREEKLEERNNSEKCGEPVDETKEEKVGKFESDKDCLVEEDSEYDIDCPVNARGKKKKHGRRAHKSRANHNEDHQSLYDNNARIECENDEMRGIDHPENAIGVEKDQSVYDGNVGIDSEDDDTEVNHQNYFKSKRRHRRRKHGHHKKDAEEFSTILTDSRNTISQIDDSRNSEYMSFNDNMMYKEDEKEEPQYTLQQQTEDEIAKGNSSSENELEKIHKEGRKKKKVKKKGLGESLGLKRTDSSNAFVAGIGSRKSIKKQKKKKVVEEAEDENVDFEKLPSIKSQLAKLFGDQYGQILIPNEDDGEELNENLDKHFEESEDYEVSELDEYTENLKGYGNELTTTKKLEGDDSELTKTLNHPKSTDTDSWLGLSGMNMNKFRSMSLPLLSDLHKMPGFDEDVSIEELKKPLRVPIYLSSFSQGKIILKKQFKSNPKRVKHRDRSHSVSVVNLTPSFLEDTSTNKSELEPVREETLTPTPEPNMGLSERAHTPLQLRVVTPTPEKPPPPVTQPPEEPPKPPPKKREIIKKEKKVKPPSEPKPPTPAHIAVEPAPTPPPIEEEKPVSREISFVREPSLPKLPPIEVPELPEFQEVHTETKSSKKERKLIEVTPDLPEQKKKLPPPPKLGPRIKARQTKRRKVAEAPVTSQELQQLSDPLDFLAKYCIINPDRLPYYERIFNGATNEQTPRYSRDQSPGGMVHLPPAQLSEHELNMLKDMTVITHAQTPRRDGLNVPEQYLEKLNYSIEFIKTKQETLHDHMHKLQAEKIRLMAQLAKEMDRDITRVDYKTKGGKKKKKDDDDSSPKKKKKKKGGEPDYDMMGAMSTSLKNFQPTKASDITDEVIVSRMDEKMLKKAKKDPIVKQFSIEISRDVEKLKNFDQRISQIEDEKDLVGLYCMDHYFTEQNDSQPPYAFRRQQSRLYQKLHPDPDVEMNIDEVETALQQINNKLLSEKEFQYIYFILDLPKREKITFRLFSIIAALSEKVTQMDPVIRKLINKVDYNALDVKMDKSKELFELLQDEDHAPVGNAPAETLAVELTAGGLTPEHTSYVLSKFNREGRGFVDFLDFVTYVPLFVDIHKRIIEDPFNDCLDI